ALIVAFCFTGRSRKTSLVSAWISDVCASELPSLCNRPRSRRRDRRGRDTPKAPAAWLVQPHPAARRFDQLIRVVAHAVFEHELRSEERRVGKEAQSRGANER